MTKVGTFRQADLTSECWQVQIHGRRACKACALRDTPECGGQNIRRTGRNAKGVEVPIGRQGEGEGDE